MCKQGGGLRGGGWGCVLLGGLEARLLVAQPRDEVLTHLHHHISTDDKGVSPHILYFLNSFVWFEVWVVPR